MDRPPTVADLLARIRAGDKAAWNELIALTYDQVKAVAQRVFRLDFATLGRHTHTTEVLHEVDRKLLEAVHRGMVAPNDEAHYFALVKQIARHTCLDLLDYLKQPYRTAGGIPDEYPVASPDATDEAEVDFADAAERLPEADFELLMLIRRGLSGNDIAAALGVSASEVSRRKGALELRLADLLDGR